MYTYFSAVDVNTMGEVGAIGWFFGVAPFIEIDTDCVLFVVVISFSDEE